nr:protease HtpX [Gammaproteobacteria bacterium]
LLIFCTIFGIGGAMISLLLSKVIAKSSMRVKLIDPQKATGGERELLQMVADLAKDAEIGMPEVGVFPSPQANAFATGWNKNKALVAVSAGMLRDFDKREVRAVMAHEVGHIANGDMVTLALIQGVINVFVLFAARVVAFFVDRFVLRREGGGIGIGYFLTVLVFDIIFGILASIVVCAFSRWREYRADRFAAVATSREDMIAALRRLQSSYEQPSDVSDSLVAFGIKGRRNRFLSLLATHPPLEKRIAALEKSAPFIT